MMYSETERKIFGPFADGKGQLVYGDPLRIDRRLTAALGGDVNAVLSQTRAGIAKGPDGADLAEPSQEGTRFEAMNRLLDAIPVAFEVAPFERTSGKGYTEDDLLTLLNAYTDFVEKKSAPGGSTPTGSAPTACPPADPYLSPTGMPCT